jgi:uncharacterized SAM-binding protein YcdF (DUF218 family)
MDKGEAPGEAALAELAAKGAVSRRWRWMLLGLAAAVAALVLAAGLLYFSGPILCVESGAPRGEVLVVLGGEKTFRPARALELYRAGAAGSILITGAGDWDEVRLYLEGNGVPASAIEVEKVSRNTKQNAEFTVRLLRARGVKRAVLVTSWFHSRRALACFRHYGPELEYVSAPTLADRPKWHWPAGYERVWVLAEYLKLVYYGPRYGVWGF